MQYVNLGCGECYHPEWINIDIISHTPDVIAFDLRKGIPLPDKSSDVVYHSNIIEHFRRNDALFFMRECFRILKPGGIIRVATPDLEEISRLYLEKLDEVRSGDCSSDPDYEWMLLEMFDQTVREQSGGEMGRYLRQARIANEPFVLQRIGETGRILLNNRTQSLKDGRDIHSFNKDVIKRMFSLLKNTGRTVRYHVLARLIIGSKGVREWEIGQFRSSGEIHHWMYDAYSLGKLLKSAGFLCPVRKNADDSMIPGFSRFHLDILPDGSVRKPDSLYIEAVRPE